MTDTPNLGLPYIDGSQAQKHVTHNEALRILDAAIQIGVLDLTLTAPPSTSGGGRTARGRKRRDRRVGRAGRCIATWQDGAWAFLAPKTGWCIWSVSDERPVRVRRRGVAERSGAAAFDDAARSASTSQRAAPICSASSPMPRCSLPSTPPTAAPAICASDLEGKVPPTPRRWCSPTIFPAAPSSAWSAPMRSSSRCRRTASAWTEAFTIDQDTGNLTLPRGLSLTGVCRAAQITADQNNYNPAGLAAASVMQINADAARNVSGLASGAEGRCVTVINVGSQPVTLLSESASSSASNRFSLASNLTIAAKQAAILRYDGTAARWQAIAGGAVSSGNAVIWPPQGRLTLQSGVPVMMSTQSAKTTLIYTLYVGNQVPIYDGSEHSADRRRGVVGSDNRHDTRTRQPLVPARSTTGSCGMIAVPCGSLMVPTGPTIRHGALVRR